MWGMVCKHMYIRAPRFASLWVHVERRFDFANSLEGVGKDNGAAAFFVVVWAKVSRASALSRGRKKRYRFRHLVSTLRPCRARQVPRGWPRCLSVCLSIGAEHIMVCRVVRDLQATRPNALATRVATIFSG